MTDSELQDIADRLEAGQADADLGGGVYKMRMARPRAGKSGGYRVIVFFRSGDKTFFHYGFAKSVRANIDERELKAHRETAKELLGLTVEQIKIRLRNGTLKEII